MNKTVDVLKVYIGKLVAVKQNSGVSSSTGVNKFNLENKLLLR